MIKINTEQIEIVQRIADPVDLKLLKIIQHEEGERIEIIMVPIYEPTKLFQRGSVPHRATVPMLHLLGQRIYFPLSVYSCSEPLREKCHCRIIPKDWRLNYRLFDRGWNLVSEINERVPDEVAEPVIAAISEQGLSGMTAMTIDEMAMKLTDDLDFCARKGGLENFYAWLDGHQTFKLEGRTKRMREIASSAITRAPINETDAYPCIVYGETAPSEFVDGPCVENPNVRICHTLEERDGMENDPNHIECRVYTREAFQGNPNLNGEDIYERSKSDICIVADALGWMN